MSYGRRDDRRDDRHDNRPYRDPRERSPGHGFGGGQRRDGRRDNRRDDRGGHFEDRRFDDRSGNRGQYESAQYNRGDSRVRGGGRGGHGGGRRGGSFGGPPPMPVSNLPPLPSSTPIPAAGRAMPDTMIKSGSSRNFEVLTNHYAIQSLPTINVYEYELRFSIPASSQRGGRSDMSPALIEKAWKAALVAGTFGRAAVFNGTSTLWSPDEFAPRDQERTSRIPLPGHSAERPNEVEVTCRRGSALKIATLVQHFTTDSSIKIDNYLVWLNALLRAYPASQHGWFSRPKGLSFFVREEGLYMPLQSTGGVLEAIRGLHQGVSTHFNCLSVNVDTSVTAFFTPDNPLINVLKAYGGLGRDAHATDLLNCNLRNLSEHLSGIFFNVTHAGPERQAARKIRAKGLHYRNGRFENASECKFMRLDPATGQETEISILDYFQGRYQVPIRYPTLPLVDSASGIFPLEFCVTASGERYKEVLEGQETADFIKFATAPAFQRSKQIEECVKRLAWHTQYLLPSHGVSVAPRMLKVPAVKLSPPPINYKHGSVNVVNGAWNLRNVQFSNAKGIRNWGVLYIPTGRGQALGVPEIETFFKILHSEMGKYGLIPPNGPPAVVLGQSQADAKIMLKKVAQDTCDKFRNSEPDMIFVLLHTGTPANVYKAIKSVCEVEFGIPTQVMLVEKSVKNGKGQAQYCANVCMKINSKLGGVNAEVNLPHRFAGGGTMIMGADVTHPSPAQLRQVPTPPSIAALTGTFDIPCVRYTAVSSPQQSTQESIAKGASMPVFNNMVETLVDRFAARNSNRKPPVVFYFRDGVGDTQVDELLQNEVKAIRDLVHSWGGKLTVILAQKRHHTRFFPIGRSNDKNGNIEPGTVVESGKGSAFVCGHGALQGTVRPSHFRIIGEDDNRLAPDELHALIMHGVHSYSKATRAVHTHASIYYADKIAERCTTRFRASGDQAFFVDVHDNLKHTMWWQ